MMFLKLSVSIPGSIEFSDFSPHCKRIRNSAVFLTKTLWIAKIIKYSPINDSMINNEDRLACQQYSSLPCALVCPTKIPIKIHKSHSRNWYTSYIKPETNHKWYEKHKSKGERKYLLPTSFATLRMFIYDGKYLLYYFYCGSMVMINVWLFSDQGEKHKINKSARCFRPDVTDSASPREQ